jgi:two-component system, NarL family, nitrate/nitrite response regulator NarL
MPLGSRIRVAIVVDHPIFREGLKHLLETYAEFEVVGEGVDGEEALRVVRLTRPDVLLLDLAMLRRDGVDTLSDFPPDATRVILLTAAMDAEHVLLAVQLGARGVVSKESPTQFLIDGIRSVMEGKYVIGSDVVDDFAQVLSRLTAVPLRPYGLTPRELEIATAVANGECNREVAQRLSISPQTVKGHLTRIFDKTGVSTRLELALFAIDHGLKK